MANPSTAPDRGPRRPDPAFRRDRLRNLFVGALVGALAALLLLPASRSFYLGAVFPSATDRALAEARSLNRGRPLVDPRDEDSRALWLKLAAERLGGKGALSGAELATVRQVARDGADAEPDNAYWLQMLAALDWLKGDAARAEDEWLRAGQALTWSDHQNGYLTRRLEPGGQVQAYAYAELYGMRSVEPARFIRRCAGKLMDAAWNADGRSLDLRVACVLNGKLIRAHARSVPQMNLGIDISGLAIERPSGAQRDDPHELLLDRLQLVKQIAQSGRPVLSKLVEREFMEDDGALALTTVEDSEANERIGGAEAAAIHAAPGALLLASLAGGLVGLLALGYRRLGALERRRPWLGAGLLGIAGMVVALFLTSPLVALILALCILFSGWNPGNVRARIPSDFGPLFGLMIGLVAFGLLAVATCAFVLLSVPGRLLVVPALNPAVDWSSAVWGLSLLLVATLFLLGPLWGFAQRVQTSAVVERALARTARATILSALVLAVVAGPLCVYAERRLGPKLEHTFANEPVYYEIR